MACISGYHVCMYVAKVPNRGSPPADPAAGKLPRGREGQEPDPGQPVVLARGQGRRAGPGAEGPAAARRGLDGAFEITRSLPHGHVAAVLGTLRDLGLEELIDPAPSRHRDLVTAMAVAQVIAPDSKLAIARGLRDATAASSLGEVLGPGLLRRG